jgi:hypothetical protein
VLGDRGFFGAAQYERFVAYLAVGVLLVVLVACWYVFVVRFSGSRIPAVKPVRRRPVDLGRLRRKYQGMIDEVEVKSAQGDLNDRAVHSRLSLLLRFFAFEASGVDAQVMTLEDLRESSLPAVAAAVEEYYPKAFRLEHDSDAERAIGTAREVVDAWS